MPWLKAFLHDALMNEHSVGFSLKRMFSLIGDGRLQALTVKAGAVFWLQLGWHHGINYMTLVPLLLVNKGRGSFCVLT